MVGRGAMTKWCGDLWGLGEVVGRRCSALLVLGLGEGMRGEESGGGDLLGKKFGGRGFIIGGNVVTLW